MGLTTDHSEFESMALQMRDLGKMGESAFSQLCASAGLTANSSDVDKTGWDFLVEFNFENEPDTRIPTIHNAATECKIQVKSTDDRKRKLSVKLSNLRRLATTPSPAFFVFLEYDNADVPQNIFLVHLDSKLISRILHRLHQANIEGEVDQLHKKTITIKYDESHRLLVSGHHIKQALRKHIGPSMADYVKEKNNHLANIGFEDGFAEIEFTIFGMDNLSKLVDSSIGIQQSADIANLIGFNKRFNLKDISPFIDVENVKLEFIDVEPNKEGKLRISKEKNGSAFSFPAQIYITPLPRSLPVELQKTRIATSFFSFIINPHINSCVFFFKF